MVYGGDWVSYIIDIDSMTKYQNIKIMPNWENNGFLLLLDGRANVITEFVNKVAPVLHVEQELITLPEHLSSPPVY